MRLIAFLTLLATPALADFPETVRDHILPGYVAFATAADGLAATAAQDCSTAAVRPASNAAFDAWLGVEPVRFGPVEENGIGLAIAQDIVRAYRGELKVEQSSELGGARFTVHFPPVF